MEAVTTTAASHKPVQEVTSVTIRFVGDSGDGMQLTGVEFTRATAVAGNDLQTFPDYPAEIRAPAGTLPGVSGFQIHFSSEAVFTPGDQPDVLVAMNPAALKANLKDLVTGGMLIVNTGAFTETNLAEGRATTANPLKDGSLDTFKRHDVDITTLTELALKDSGLSAKEVARGEEHVRAGHDAVDVRPPARADAAIPQGQVRHEARHPRGQREGAAWPATTTARRPSCSPSPTQVKRAAITQGRYRNVTGNEATALGHSRGHQAVGHPRLPRQLPHHACLRHPARAAAPQALRLHHLPGGGRDRRHVRGGRRGLRRGARPSPPRRARAWR